MILPQNSIVIWSDCVNIPDGWTLCDGSNDTPNLQGRFVVGGGTSFNYGNIGGTSSHSHTITVSEHTGSVGNTALSISQMPAHNHGNGDYQYLLKSDCKDT